VECGKAMVMEAVASAAEDQNSDDPGAYADNQLTLDDLVKPVDWPEDKTWETFTIDASCKPADITYPTDLKLLNEARDSIERFIYDLIEIRAGLGGRRPRYGGGKARANVLNVAKQKKPHRRKIKAAIRRQLEYLQRNLGTIDALITSWPRLSDLKTHSRQKYLVICELYRLRSILLYSNTRSIPDRIVNLVQRQACSSARGKARAALNSEP